MSDSLKKLNELRLGKYKKDISSEEAILKINKALRSVEEPGYTSVESKNPLIFVVGLPRSGTTFLTQVLLHGFDLGYINNIVARFWLAPLSGLTLSDQLLGNSKAPESLNSTYAVSEGLAGIHEFGYFWRHWLQKETVNDFIHYKQKESSIDWNGLKKVLNSIQHKINEPMVMKNNFGGFHMNHLLELLPNSLFIYIKRNLMDVAISILKARKHFYGNIDTWWSTIPPDYNELKSLNPHEQIAGQVRSLTKLYELQIEESPFQERILTISYEELSANPKKSLNHVSSVIKSVTDTKMTVHSLSTDTATRRYAQPSSDKNIFEKLLS